MIELAKLHAPASQIHYTGVDLFEARLVARRARISLKAAHRLLRTSGARIQLVPGDPFTALSRVANGLSGTDLVVISAGQDLDSLARAWYYLPRMLGATSQVLIEEAIDSQASPVIRSVPADEVSRRAAAATLRRAA